MKVYVITEGSYSDYHIVCVTLDKKIAKEFCKLHTDKKDYRVFNLEEYDTDTMQLLHDGLSVFSVKMKGEKVWAVKCDEDDFHYWLDELNDVSWWCPQKAGESERVYLVHVLAKDDAHAIKIATDLFTQFKYKKKVEESV